MPIESFVTTLIHWTFFSDDANIFSDRSGQLHVTPRSRMISASLSQISPQRHATLPTHQTVPSTTPYYKVLKSATPELFCTTKYYSRKYSSTTKYYSSTIPYYKVLVQYYSVLQTTTPVLLRTTKYYSSTTPYYKVLLQYYSVLQSTTPVLLRTTKYYSSTKLQSTTPVLQSTTPVLLRTTMYYSSTTKYYSSTTKYYSSTTRPVLLRTTKY